MEFQTRGSSHIHSFIWVINAPKLSSENIDKYTDWIDGLITADLPNPETDSSLYELVKTYQSLDVQNHAESIKMINGAFSRIKSNLSEWKIKKKHG